MSKNNTFQVGHRYLVEDNDSYTKTLIEIEILEISPGGRIKYKYSNSGLIVWTENKDRYGDREEYKIIEDLGAVNSNLKPDKKVKVPKFLSRRP